MSTLKVAAINNPSASSGGLAISASGNVTGAGLDLITTQSFSAVSSVSVNNCFSATYDNYRVVIAASGSVDGSAGTATRIRLRSAGTDYSASTYAEFGIFVNASSGPSRYFNNSVAQATIGWHFNYSGISTVDFASPATSGAYKHYTSTSLGTGTADGYGGYASGRVLTTSAYDGFTFFPTSGTLTGTVSIYGYRR